MLLTLNDLENKILISFFFFQGIFSNSNLFQGMFLFTSNLLAIIDKKKEFKPKTSLKLEKVSENGIKWFDIKKVLRQYIFNSCANLNIYFLLFFFFCLFLYIAILRLQINDPNLKPWAYLDNFFLFQNLPLYIENLYPVNKAGILAEFFETNLLIR